MMVEKMKDCVVVSATNLVEGGAFKVLKECLKSLLSTSIIDDYKVLALVNNKGQLPQDDRIQYIEFPKSKKHYLYRFYYEYYKLGKLSKQYRVKLWLSLHDMSPRVKAGAEAWANGLCEPASDDYRVKTILINHKI